MTQFDKKLAAALKKCNREPLPVSLRRPEVLQCPQIPKPMHCVSPRAVLGSAWWNAERRAAYASTNYHCIACGVHKGKARFHQWLEGHELYFTDYHKGRLTYLETVPLCHACHNYIHRGRLQALLDEGQITGERFSIIVRHGDKALREAGLFKPDEYSGPIAKWADWRLVVGDKEYEPKFKSFEAWQRFFSSNPKRGK